MKPDRFVLPYTLLLCFCISLCLCACGDSDAGLQAPVQTQNPHESAATDKTADSTKNETTASDANKTTASDKDQTTSSDTDKSADSSDSGSRDNTPVVLVPSADGSEVFSCDVAVIDVSNKSQGYIMVDYSGGNPKVKLQLTGPDGVTYTYNLHGGYEVFPLTAGNGTYSAGIFENIEDTQYATVLSQDFSVDITNTFGPYLYPNQYVDFSPESAPIAKSEQLAASASSDVEVVENVYNYIIENFTYDYDKASSVESGYLPDVDNIFASNTGICFDYAAVMATMLRTQNIPTRLEVGYMEEAYHAWISTYIKDIGWINGIIEFDGESWNLMDPTFASTSSSPGNFITENTKYTTKYVY